MRDRIKGLKKEKREISAVRKAERAIDPQVIVRGVARKYALEPERLLRRGERGLEARNVAMWLIWESGALTLSAIGQLFGGLDYAAVAQRIRRTRLAVPLATRKKLIREILNV